VGGRRRGAFCASRCPAVTEACHACPRGCPARALQGLCVTRGVVAQARDRRPAKSAPTTPHARRGTPRDASTRGRRRRARVTPGVTRHRSRRGAVRRRTTPMGRGSDDNEPSRQDRASRDPVGRGSDDNEPSRRDRASRDPRREGVRRQRTVTARSSVARPPLGRGLLRPRWPPQGATPTTGRKGRRRPRRPPSGPPTGRKGDLRPRRRPRQRVAAPRRGPRAETCGARGAGPGAGRTAPPRIDVGRRGRRCAARR